MRQNTSRKGAKEDRLFAQSTFNLSNAYEGIDTYSLVSVLNDSQNRINYTVELPKLNKQRPNIRSREDMCYSYLNASVLSHRSSESNSPDNYIESTLLYNDSSNNYNNNKLALISNSKPSSSNHSNRILVTLQISNNNKSNNKKTKSTNYNPNNTKPKKGYELQLLNKALDNYNNENRYNKTHSNSVIINGTKSLYPKVDTKFENHSHASKKEINAYSKKGEIRFLNILPTKSSSIHNLARINSPVHKRSRTNDEPWLAFEHILNKEMPENPPVTPQTTFYLD